MDCALVPLFPTAEAVYTRTLAAVHREQASLISDKIRDGGFIGESTVELMAGRDATE